jgi:hypothetical protein
MKVEGELADFGWLESTAAGVFQPLETFVFR